MPLSNRTCEPTAGFMLVLGQWVVHDIHGIHDAILYASRMCIPSNRGNGLGTYALTKEHIARARMQVLRVSRREG